MNIKAHEKPKVPLSRYLASGFCLFLMFPTSVFAAEKIEGMKVYPQLSHEEKGSPAYESAPPEGIKSEPQLSEGPSTEPPTYPPSDYERRLNPPLDDSLLEEEPVEKIEAEEIEPQEKIKRTPPEVEEEGPAYPSSRY